MLTCADKPLGRGAHEQWRLFTCGLEARAPACTSADRGGALVIRRAEARPRRCRIQEAQAVVGLRPVTCTVWSVSDSIYCDHSSDTWCPLPLVAIGSVLQCWEYSLWTSEVQTCYRNRTLTREHLLSTNSLTYSTLCLGRGENVQLVYNCGVY